MSRPAGDWRSPLDAGTVAAAGLRLAQPMLHDGWCHWLEGRPAEGGRVVLLRARGGEPDAVPEELAPAPLSVRTRVHEYGGGAYLACAAGVLFIAEGVHEEQGSHAGCLWWRRPDGSLASLAMSAGLRCADLELDAARARLLCVVEDARQDPHRPRNLIAAVSLTPGAAQGAITELVTGHDFFASPRLSPDGRTLAWLAWDLPEMPWDGAVLCTASLDAAGRIGAITHRAGPAAFQPEFAPDGRLWWSDDADGRFTLAAGATDASLGVARTAAAPDGAAMRFPDAARECALPLWNLNMRCFGASGDRMVAASVAEGLWALRELDPACGAWLPFGGTAGVALTQIEHLHATADAVVVLGGGPREALGVHRFDRASGKHELLARSIALTLAPGLLATPEPLTFPGDDGGTVHALWWPPTNADHALAAGERPPLLLRCHGGPTALAPSALDPRTLYWTSRGFAVLDLNYRGSWGFGRDYRRALDGAWGERDARDAVAAARFAIASGRADPARIAITGASAGGLTALNAASLPRAPFRSVAAHYGLAELASAMTDTHKFEAGYGERLIGAWPAARAVYAERSPLARVAALAAAAAWPPTILFQGADDRVVPPDQSERLAAALRARGVAVELHVYPGEGHGFRRAATVIDVLERELAFHQKMLGISGATR